MNLWYGEKRWKLEAKLTYLRSERDRFDALYEKTLQSLAERSEERIFSSNMLADILVSMPQEVVDEFHKYAEPNEIEHFERKKRYLELVAAMKRDLKAREKQIFELLQN